MQLKVLQFGKTPPPFGGVTVHVKRLVDNLEERNIDVIVFSKIKDLFLYPTWHIHLNHSYKRFLIVLLARILQKKVICTLHRDHKRDRGAKSFFNYLSFRFSSSVVLLNISSYNHYKSYFSNKTYLVSAFIPPSDIELKKFPLKIKDRKLIELKNKRYDKVYCTCAHHLRYLNGKDIYGIEEIISSFREHIKNYLIVSDPSGEYRDYFQQKKIEIPNNVHFITYQHSFLNVLRLSDAYIRNTITDGDSLSIHEALYYNKSVYCTDVVNRPDGCNLYSIGNFQSVLTQSKFTIKTNKPKYTAVESLIKLYEN